MTKTRRGLLFHITHRDNLEAIAQNGLLCDRAITDSGQIFKEVGEPRIKLNRRGRRVPVSPGGVVADYVPFYFAARSPMLYAITMGNVPSYQGGQGELVYLVTSVSALLKLGLQFVFTDRNAALALAHFSNDLDELNDHVDWDLMEARMWNNTVEHPDRMERRMAEMLVHRHVPWAAFEMVAVRTERQKQRVSTVLANVGANTEMRVEPDWYF